MNDNLFIEDILTTEKNMTINIAIFLNETSNDNLYKEVFEMFKQISKCAKGLFTICYNKNIYPVSAVSESKINSAITKLEKDLTNMC